MDEGPAASAHCCLDGNCTAAVQDWFFPVSRDIMMFPIGGMLIPKSFLSKTEYNPGASGSFSSANYNMIFQFRFCYSSHYVWLTSISI